MERNLNLFFCLIFLRRSWKWCFLVCMCLPKIVILLSLFEHIWFENIFKVRKRPRWWICSCLCMVCILCMFRIRLTQDHVFVALRVLHVEQTRPTRYGVNRIKTSQSVHVHIHNEPNKHFGIFVFVCWSTWIRFKPKLCK